VHSIAIFFGFLIGTFGLAWCRTLAMAFWQTRGDPRDDAVLSDRWVRPAFAIIVFPVPILLAIGGGLALYWGFFGT
jgi:hypothetical protein